MTAPRPQPGMPAAGPESRPRGLLASANFKLYASWHLLGAVLTVLAFVIWAVVRDIALGRSARIDLAYILWTGWIALALFVVAALYVARKYAHKRRITPEFRWERPVEQLERAQARLAELRGRVFAGELKSLPAVRRAAKKILRSEGVGRVLRADVRRGPPGEPPLSIVAVSREPILRVSRWIPAHVYYGLAAGCLIWLHGGGNFATPMGALLNGLSAVVLGTGIAGILLWTFGPTWLTRNERDLSLEETFNFREHYRRKVKEAEAELRAAIEAKRPDRVDGLLDGLRRLGDRAGGGEETRRFLADLPPDLQPDLGLCREVLVLRSQCRNVESEWRRLGRIRFALGIWRAVHVPASIVLLTLVGVHVFSVWWY